MEIRAIQVPAGDDSMLGFRFNNGWTIDRKIATGGQGTIWRAVDADFASTYRAVKVLAIPQMDSSDLRNWCKVQRFRQEAELTRIIDSPHVVRSFEHGTISDGVFYNQMEYAGDCNLDDELKRRTAAPELSWVLAVLAQTAQAMLDVHAAGVVHRDLKPANLMLSSHPAGGVLVKLIDFGLATTRQRHLTRVPSIIGTPGFLPPEAASGRRVDGSADVYALGVIAYRLTTGRFPFSMQRVSAYVPEPPSIEARRPRGLEKVPAPVVAVVARALARDPSLRPTMSQICDAIGEALAGVAPPVPPRVSSSISAAVVR